MFRSAMNPPSRAPRTASRKQGSWGRRRGVGSTKKRPKRLLNKENACPNPQEFKLSPEVVHIHKSSPLTLSSPGLPILTPPPFNLSFGAELSSELLLYMDELEHNLSPSIAKALPSQQQNSWSHLNISSAALFDSSVSATSNHPRDISINHSNGSIHSPRSQKVANTSASFLTTPSKSIKNHLLLSNWGLPDKILEQYSSRGITSMFDWQAECLMLPGILSGRNLVYSAPTSAGKTLIAELLALKCVLELRKKVLIILPFVSIAHEKSNYLQQVFEPSGVKVGGFMGSQSPAGGFASVDIAICTIEKANSLVNRLLEENNTHQLGVVIVDELHMIGDHHRGYLLELLLTKLMFVHQKVAPSHDPMNSEPNNGLERSQSTSVQLIGMSATLPNLSTLASWLQAELYHTEFRPVPLKEMVKIGPTIYTTDFNKLQDIDQSESVPGDEDDILFLCRERIIQGHSVLIFCPTKVWCENLAATLAGALAGFVDCRDERGKLLLNVSSLVGICEQLRRTQVGLDRILEQTIPKGIAFHHAGLTFDEREIIEGAFRKSHIKILIATSTLSSGVNLPARLVIVRTPFFQRSLINILVYKQMVGRAGRKGVDESGESILICKPKERSKVVALLKSAPKPVRSYLGSSKDISNSASGGELTAMKRALLEVISSNTATKMGEIEKYTSCTLLFAELKDKLVSTAKSPGKSPSKKDITKTLLQSTIDFLLKNDFINNRQGKAPNLEAQPNEPPPAIASENGQYFATQLGTATVASALSPDEALVVFSELRKARRSFVLENELHIIYLVTPVYVQEQWPNIDWYKYLCLWERLPPDMKLVADTLGVKESFLARAVQGRVPERTLAQKEALRIHRRFFTALALHDLVHEVPIVYVARRYGASKGLLQTLQSAAGTFAGMVTVFCNRLGWKNLELLLSQFQSRLMFGVERELCELVQISLLNGFRARVLYNTGFHTLASLATANPIAIETCLRNAIPFKSNKLAQDYLEERDTGGMGTAATYSTWCAKLRRGMTEEEAARAIVREAQEMLAQQLNVPATVWGVSEAKATGMRDGAKNKAPPTDEHLQVQAKPPNKSLVMAEPIDNHVTSMTNEIAALRGHRTSPNTGEAGEEIGIKKPCLQTSKTTSATSCEARIIADSLKSSNTKLSAPKNLVVQQTLHSSNLKLNSHVPQPLLCPDFRQASSLLLSVNKESTPAQPKANPKRRSVVNKSAISLSPIPPFNIDSEIPPKMSTETLDMKLASRNAVSHVPCEVFKKDKQEQSLSSPDKQFTIPDSLPNGMDGSMSFSFHTFEMIDAACDDVNLIEEKQQQSPKQIASALPNSAAKAVEKSGTGMNCIAESLAFVDTNLLAVKPSNMVNDSADFNSFSFSPLLSPSNDDKSITPPTKTPNRLQSTERVAPATGTVPETPSSLSTSLLLPASQMNSLKELSSLCSSQMSQSGVTVIEVTSNPALFKIFLSECLEQRAISFSVATSKIDQGNGIGSTILKPRESRGIPLPNQNEQVVGVAICWGGMDAYYVSLCHDTPDEDNKVSVVELSLKQRIKAVRKIFSDCLACEKLIAYNIKKHLVHLAVSCGIALSGKIMDPIVASWMLDPDAKEKTIHRMVLQYLPDQPSVSEDEDLNEMPLSSLATHSSDPQMRASAESILAFLLMSKMESLLEAEGLVKPFVEVEMPTLSVLSKMELNGIGFSLDECNHQKDILQSRITELEKSAYVLARHPFSLTSPEDIAQVLFIELKLPCGSETGNRQSKTLGPNTRRGGGKKRIQHLSTAKDVLEKIRPLHPLPGIVLEWRRISSTLTKMVFPLFKEAVSHDTIGSVRIHPQVHIHTATGRVSVSDPSLQMVPKEFDLGCKLNLDSLSLTHNDELLSDSQFLAADRNEASSNSSPLPSSVCMRNVFVPFPGGVFLAADYSQLELRILAHVSGDVKLKKFLNSDGDVFKMIAGEWLGLSAGEVSERQRQETKQVCYGMVYGIGAKALGEQLGIIEEDASQFMETFKSKYPTMKKFLSKTVQECREKGYVTTLLGRKRFLSSIHSPNIHARSQAERQAVNTTIQGSAADLVKMAMVNIDKRLLERFPDSGSGLDGPIINDTSGTPKRPTGAYLVLQLHDELLYDVAEKDLMEVARIVKHEMENALEMSVRFPVKVKVGPSWGKLEPYTTN